MPEIKRIFDEKYRCCDINRIPKYEKGKYHLGTTSKPTIYSVDCLYERHPKIAGDRCDEIIFFEFYHSIAGIYLIESKTNSQDVDKVKRQLDGGAGFINNFLENDPATEGERLDFMPIWVSKGLKNSTRRKLSTVKVKLRNRSKRIRHIDNNRTLPKFK